MGRSKSKAANWYACADRGGRWPMMLGPYDETRARGEAANYPGGFAVGFATSADRGDFLRRWEDAHGDAAARAAIVARLQGFDEGAALASVAAAMDEAGLLPARGGFVQHVGAVGCDDCERSYGPGALCRCEAETCEECGGVLAGMFEGPLCRACEEHATDEAEARAEHDADMRARAEYGDPTAIAWGEQ